MTDLNRLRTSIVLALAEIAKTGISHKCQLSTNLSHAALASVANSHHACESSSSGAAIWSIGAGAIANKTCDGTPELVSRRRMLLPNLHLAR